jgi:hypothetical protein
MTVELKLPPEMEAVAQSEAKKRSQDMNAYLTDLIADSLAGSIAQDDRERRRAILRMVGEIGDEAEQQETFEYLREAVDADRLSLRKRFP